MPSGQEKSTDREDIYDEILRKEENFYNETMRI